MKTMIVISSLFGLGIWVVAAQEPSSPGSESNRPPPPPRPGAERAVADDAPRKPVEGFVLQSPAVRDGAMLPVEFTGDGESATLPLEWKGAPAGTKSFTVIMHHLAPDKIKWYWILYDIPATVQSLPKNVKGVGTLGNNSVNGRLEYAPPHSKGPGPKTYVYTVYALSAAPLLRAEPAAVSREALLDAMKGLILGTAELKVVYARAVEGGAGKDVPTIPVKP